MAIPKIIHYCWFGGKELPEEVLQCIESWKKYCPDYEIQRWDETNYDYTKIPFTKQAYEQKKWAFVSDVARLQVVYDCGGIYLDTDVELIKPLDAFLKEAAFLGMEQGRAVATGLGFGAEKGNAVLAGNIQEYEKITFINRDGSLNLIPCPTVTTRYLEKLGLQREDKLQKIQDVTIYPSEYFSPRLLENGRAETTENTVSIHHYAGTWTTQKERNKANRRIRIYSRYGKTGLSIYDGLVLLQEGQIRAFAKRFAEKFLSKK